MILTNLLSENEATTQYSDEEAENKVILLSCLLNQTMEYFQDLIFLHPPVNEKSRNRYRSIFQAKYDFSPNIWNFVDRLFEMIKETRRSKCMYSLETLELFTEVMQKDVEFWSKHNKSNNNSDTDMPLVKYMFDVKPDSYNEERVETVINHFMFSIKV